MKKIGVILFLGVAFFSQAAVNACTGIMLKNHDRSTVNGRTVEFGINIDFNVAVIPRNYTFDAKTPIGKGLSYTSKYAVLGIYCFDEPILMDGMNEKGLTAAAFYFPGYARYTTITKQNQRKALSSIDFTNWILTQFGTLEEIKEAVKDVVIAPTVYKDWGEAPPPMHYIVYDKEGKSIVIEPLEGGLKVYDNELGVITNSPTFDWHMTNLNNYINLQAQNVQSKRVGDIELHPLGQGTGMLGVPGDYTPPSRFVRAAWFAISSVPAASSDEGVYRAFHLLNNFDIPYGAVKEEQRGKVGYDYTLATSVKDPKRLRYYYRTYDDQEIKCVDLNKFDPTVKDIKMFSLKGKDKVEDVSDRLR